MNDTGKKLLSLKVLIYTNDLLHDHDIVADPKRPALQVCNRRKTNFEGVNAAATSGHCSKRKMKGHLVMARRNPPEILRILPIDVPIFDEQKLQQLQEIDIEIGHPMDESLT